jgi:hypothetical protein
MGITSYFGHKKTRFKRVMGVKRVVFLSGSLDLVTMLFSMVRPEYIFDAV